jgi:hypothetical protein
MSDDDNSSSPPTSCPTSGIGPFRERGPVGWLERVPDPPSCGMMGDVPQIVKTGGDWLMLGWSFGG